jgi:beta-hydroxyacyl-ACP dehydratase FabZ
MSTSFDIVEIMKFLPHRYPFILVDRVLSLEHGKRIVALKNVSMNEPFFQGHFPGQPIMPGVLIIEALAQAGGVLVIESFPPERHGTPVLFMAIDKARFRKPVVPGDQIILELEILKSRAAAVKMSALATVEGARVAEAELMATFGDKL